MLVSFNNSEAFPSNHTSQQIKPFKQRFDGEYTNELIKSLKQLTGYDHVVLTHSGTSALEVVASYLANDYEKVVDLPAVSYPATVNAFLLAGWKVRFMDVDDNGMAIPLDDSIVSCPVGLYGTPIDYQKYKTASNLVIEDACQSWTTVNDSRHTKIISFDPTKNIISVGNGGAILTNDSKLAEWATSYCNHGKIDGKFVMPGSNIRMNEYEAYVVNLQLRKLEFSSNMRTRRAIVLVYDYRLRDLPITLLTNNPEIDYQKYVIKTQYRNELAVFLKIHGVETKIHYEVSLPDLPYTTDCQPPPTNNYKKFCEQVLSLPYQHVPIEQQNYLINKIQTFLK